MGLAGLGRLAPQPVEEGLALGRFGGRAPLDSERGSPLAAMAEQGGHLGVESGFGVLDMVGVVGLEEQQGPGPVRFQ